MATERVRKLRFPLSSHSVAFRIYRLEDYTIDDLVVHGSRNSVTGRVLGTQENLFPARKLRNVLVGPAKDP